MSLHIPAILMSMLQLTTWNRVRSAINLLWIIDDGTIRRVFSYSKSIITCTRHRIPLERWCEAINHGTRRRTRTRRGCCWCRRRGFRGLEIPCIRNRTPSSRTMSLHIPAILMSMLQLTTWNRVRSAINLLWIIDDGTIRRVFSYSKGIIICS